MRNGILEWWGLASLRLKLLRNRSDWKRYQLLARVAFKHPEADQVEEDFT
jgi:hypothetical protein